MKPVVYCHVTKTGGQSVGALLRDWFGINARGHYRADTAHVIDLERQLPEEYRPKVIYGHFVGVRTDEWYPKDYLGDHAIMLREPLCRFVSAFNFVNRDDKNRFDTPEAFLHGGSDLLLDAMRTIPMPLSEFALVGTTERMREFCEGLAKMLGKEMPPETPHKNISKGLTVDELSPDLVVQHRKMFAAEYDLYERAVSWR